MADVAPPQSPPPTPRGPTQIALALADIKLAHSVFALPFAMLAAFLLAPPTNAPAADWAIFALQLTLVVVCMVFARTWAMLINRIADRAIDADNPRTARRALASGRLRLRSAIALAAAAALGFQLGAAAFWLADANWWPAALAPAVLIWIGFYSLTKRFTLLCHAFLGAALATSPIAAAIAIDPAAVLTASPSPAGVAIFWLAGFVLMWVAGFDIAYALQDLDFDRGAGLRSIPAALGWRGALWASRAAHVVAVAALIAAWRADPRLGWIFGAAVVLVAVALIAEHVVLARRGLAGLPLAFFTLNGVISLVIGLFGSVDAVLANT